MSKNYTNYNKPKRHNPIPTDVVNADVEPVVETAVPIVDSADEVDVVEAAPETTVKEGYVNVPKLNVRKLPSPTATPVTVINKDTKVLIDPDYETVEWVKVTLESGIEGYCMKKFITVK